MNKEEFDKVCCNCNNFHPTKDLDYGICLDDKEFEPYLDELIENNNIECCDQLIEQKKMQCDTEACDKFDLIDFEGEIQIDDDSAFGKLLNETSLGANVDSEQLNIALAKDYIDRIDWKTISVEQYVEKLYGNNEKDSDEALSTLFCLLYQGNQEAFKTLVEYSMGLPICETISDVHIKLRFLDGIIKVENKAPFVPFVIKQLNITPINGTTTQWISALLKFLSRCPYELIEEPLEQMLKNKKFSYRRKNQIKAILDGQKY